MKFPFDVVVAVHPEWPAGLALPEYSSELTIAREFFDVYERFREEKRFPRLSARDVVTLSYMTLVNNVGKDGKEALRVAAKEFGVFFNELGAQLRKTNAERWIADYQEMLFGYFKRTLDNMSVTRHAPSYELRFLKEDGIDFEAFERATRSMWALERFGSAYARPISPEAREEIKTAAEKYRPYYQKRVASRYVVLVDMVGQICKRDGIPLVYLCDGNEKIDIKHILEVEPKFTIKTKRSQGVPEKGQKSVISELRRACFKKPGVIGGAGDKCMGVAVKHFLDNGVFDEMSFIAEGVVTSAQPTSVSLAASIAKLQTLGYNVKAEALSDHEPQLIGAIDEASQQVEW